MVLMSLKIKRFFSLSASSSTKKEPEPSAYDWSAPSKAETVKKGIETLSLVRGPSKMTSFKFILFMICYVIDWTI